MSGKKVICASCGENETNEVFACPICGNQICHVCAQVCKKCGEAFCEACSLEHNDNCIMKNG